jgi:hypothetical protein
MKCVVCHVPFKAHRADALTCSGRCRVAYHRYLQEITPPWPTPPPGGYQLVSIDLPLGWEAYSPKGEGRSPQSKYPTLEPRTCIRLLRPMLMPVYRGGVMAKNSVSAWWVYGPRREPSHDARFRVALGQIIEGCGYTVTTELLTWIIANISIALPPCPPPLNPSPLAPPRAVADAEKRAYVLADKVARTSPPPQNSASRDLSPLLPSVEIRPFLTAAAPTATDLAAE